MLLKPLPGTSLPSGKVQTPNTALKGPQDPTLPCLLITLYWVQTKADVPHLPHPYPYPLPQFSSCFLQWNSLPAFLILGDSAHVSPPVRSLCRCPLPTTGLQGSRPALYITPFHTELWLQFDSSPPQGYGQSGPSVLCPPCLTQQVLRHSLGING